MTRPEDALVVCEHCGKPHRRVALAPGATASCTRCEAVIGRGHRIGIESVLALTVASFIVFLIATSTDVLAIRLGSTTATTTLPGAIGAAWNEGERLIAVLTALTAMVAPALYIGLRLYVLVPLASGKVPLGFGPVVRVLHQASRWSMVEVLTVAGLLSLVRLAALADASPGPAMFALGTLTLLFAAIEQAGIERLWSYVP